MTCHGKSDFVRDPTVLHPDQWTGSGLKPGSHFFQKIGGKIRECVVIGRTVYDPPHIMRARILGVVDDRNPYFYINCSL